MKLADDLKGKFFHTFHTLCKGTENAHTEVSQQGRLLAYFPEEQLIKVEFYDWIMGNVYKTTYLPIEWIIDQELALYETDEEMKDAYETTWKQKSKF